MTDGPTPNPPIETINAQEEEKRIFRRVEAVMDEFRGDQLSRFKAVANVTNELDKWAGVSDEVRGNTLATYLEEIHAQPIGQDPGQSNDSHAKGTSSQSIKQSRATRKRTREEVDDLFEHISGDGDLDDDEPAQPVSGKRRAQESEMPWYKPGAYQRPSCTQTCTTLRKFGDDLSGTKSLLCTAAGLPDGIPSSQWDRILKGESIDLNQILSSMHCVQLNDERKGRLGESEVVFAVAEAKRQVKTGSEWTIAFRRASRAILFLFPHRRGELDAYSEYIESLFAAKQSSAHHRVILFDSSVRNLVGGGQNTLLTDLHKFQALHESMLQADGVEYASGSAGTNSKHGGNSKQGGGDGKQGGRKRSKTCRRFNTKDGCKFDEGECHWNHTCFSCGKTGHGKHQCPTEKSEK